jgi:hypothetical protein
MQDRNQQEAHDFEVETTCKLILNLQTHLDSQKFKIRAQFQHKYMQTHVGF